MPRLSSPRFSSFRASLVRFRRGARFAVPFRRSILTLGGITLFLAVASAAEPLALKYIFDQVSAHARFEPLLVGVGILAALGIFRELASTASNWLTWKVRIGIHYDLLTAMVDRLHCVPLSYHREQGVGAIMTKLDRGIQGFLNALSQILFNIFPAVLYLLLAIFVMWRMSISLTLLVLCFAPLPAVIAALAAPEQTRRERALFDRYVRIYSRFNEVLAGILTVRTFAMEEREKQRFLGEVNGANQLVIRGVRTDSISTGATSFAIMIARLAAIALGGVLMIRGQITIGTVFAFLGYIGGVFGPVQGLSGMYQTLQKASVSLDEMLAILDLEEHLPDSPNAKPLGAIRGDVEFDHVHFAYEHSAEPILRGVDLRAAPGETIAIVGPSGSGKSTLMGLLMRFHDPVQGTVRIDGADLRELERGSLRRQIGVVLQEPLLFNDTVRNNIAYGQPDATMEEVIAAAEAANAHGFITALREGYDTMLGERGGRLSVGERQRVTIARALLKNPPLIILDEATSSLDAESEALVQEALDRLMKGRTTFVIAHRLTTVVHASRIIVLKEGHIVESGSHTALMRLGGYYASLVHRQTRGLLINDGEAVPDSHDLPPVAGLAA